MFQREIDEMLKGSLNALAVADDILVKGYNADGADHDKTRREVLRISRKENLKLNKSEMSFHMYQFIFSENIEKWCKARSSQTTNTDKNASPHSKNDL